MRDDSSTWVDVKVKIEGQLLLHLEMRGYRSNQDITVQLNYINDGLITSLEDCLLCTPGRGTWTSGTWGTLGT